MRRDIQLQSRSQLKCLSVVWHGGCGVRSGCVWVLSVRGWVGLALLGCVGRSVGTHSSLRWWMWDRRMLSHSRKLHGFIGIAVLETALEGCKAVGSGEWGLRPLSINMILCTPESCSMVNTDKCSQLRGHI